MTRVSKREAPSPNQCATSSAAPNRRLYLNTFRGEPAISGFAWHFTATHRSSQPFVTDSGSGLHGRIPLASPCPWVDHPVSGHLHATRRPLRLAFAPAPPVRWLSLATCTYSLAHSTKGTPSHLAVLRPAGGTWFQVLFHSPRRGAFHLSLTVLVHYRSSGVFSLGPWAALLPTRFHVSGGTHVPDPHPTVPVRLRDSHPLRSPVPAAFGSQASVVRDRCRSLQSGRPTPVAHRRQPVPHDGFGLLPVRSPLLRESSLFLGVREMFQFPRFPPHYCGPVLRQGVAPFGDRRIIGCQPLPDAFRRVATSFIGP